MDQDGRTTVFTCSKVSVNLLVSLYLLQEAWEVYLVLHVFETCMKLNGKSRFRKVLIISFDFMRTVVVAPFTQYYVWRFMQLQF